MLSSTLQFSLQAVSGFPLSLGWQMQYIFSNAGLQWEKIFYLEGIAGTCHREMKRQ
jgi:hypothetical protein